MKYIVTAGVLVGFAIIGSSALAPLRLGATVDAAAAQATTLEGCLKPGPKGGEYALSADGANYLVMPGIGVELNGHLNKVVQVTGSVEKGSRGNVLRASGIKIVAETCAVY